MEKDPTSWSIATWFLVIGVSIMGGLVNYMNRIKIGHTRPFNLIELVGEITASALVGFCMFSALAALNQPAGICAAAAGVGGHMGTRLLFRVERIIESKLNKITDNKGEL